MKRILSTLLCVMMIFPMCTFAESSSYETVSKDISREEFCNLAYDMLSVCSDMSSTPVDTNPFEDTANDKVIALHLEGIIEGKSANKFAPDDLLTREEAATILQRIADRMNLLHTEMHFSFDDIDNVSDWAMDSVQTVCNLGVMNGIGNNLFDPKSNFTTIQAEITLSRLSDIVNPISNEPETFADKMYVNMPDDVNFMFSPLSVKMALMMAANGADGETRREILEAVDVSDIQSYNNSVKRMIETYSQADLLKLDVSNSVWINSDRTPWRFSNDYTEKISDVFDATSGVVTNENAKDTINGWVDEKTSGKIPEIVSGDNSDFWAMLVNAVYFKGRWAEEFYEGATKKDNFTSKDGETSEIDFMNRTDYMTFSEEDGVTIVALPYLHRESIVDENSGYIETNYLDSMDICMYLMMSDSDFIPGKVLENAEFSTEYVSLSVPKFKIEYSAGIKEILQTLGIEKAFEQSAEFENMFDEGNMYIDSVIHKTYIDVNEEGTEAAAVTAVVMAGAGMRIPPEPIEVKFNKPFTFVIKDNANGEILFMGDYSFAQ